MKYLALPSKRKDRADYCSIYARVRKGTLNKKYSTGLMVSATEWDKYNKGTFNLSDWMESINLSYTQFDKILTDIKVLLESEFNPDTAIEEIKHIREENTFIEAKKSKVELRKQSYYFSVYMQNYIEGYVDGTRTVHNSGILVSKSYIGKFKGTLRKINMYEEEYGRIPVKRVDMNFRNSFMTWLNKRGYSANTIACDLDIVRQVLKNAHLDRLTDTLDYLNPDFVPKREKTEDVYLTPDMIDEIYNADFTSADIVEKIKEIHMKEKGLKKVRVNYVDFLMSSLDIARDLFLVGCLTGQRESDFMRINKDMVVSINGEKFLKLTQVKTKKTIFIPLDKRVEHIIAKYDGTMPKITIVNFGRFIRIMCEVLGWTWQPKVSKINKRLKVNERFCDLVTSHTARRSFATNAYAAGIPLTSIMAITGHCSENRLRRYLKLDAEEKALIADIDMNGFIKASPA